MTAFVTLQENNALAVVDLANAEVMELLPLGFKTFSAPVATLDTYASADRPVLGTTAAGQEIMLGGFSGLFYEGVDDSGRLVFVTHTDRGPNPEPVDVDDDGVNERPFALPDFQPVIVRLAVDPAAGAPGYFLAALFLAADFFTTRRAVSYTHLTLPTSDLV